MLGKRARAQMRRTASMAGITVDPAGGDSMEARPPLDLQSPAGPVPVELEGPADEPHHAMMVGPAATASVIDHQRLTAVLSPRYYRADLSEHGGFGTADFLRTCGLCNRCLAPGRDIFMYRGDTAFCSQECREQMMKQDERREKRKMGVSKRVESHHNQYSELNTAASDSSSNSETIAAA